MFVQPTQRSYATARYDNDERGTGMPGINDTDMRQAFRLLDLDRDGQISSHDLKIFLQSIGETPTDVECNEMIRMADSGKDGSVHLSEFCDIFRELNRDGSDNEIYAEIFPHMANLRAQLQSSNKSGVIDTTEEILKRFVSRLPGAITGAPWMKRDALKDIIARWKQYKFDFVTEMIKHKAQASGKDIFKVTLVIADEAFYRERYLKS